MLYSEEDLIKKGKEMAVKENLQFVGLTILNGDYNQITYHLEILGKGVELK